MELSPVKNLDLDDIKDEVWLDVFKYEDIYQVSNRGRVKTKFRKMYYDRGLGRGKELKTVYPRIRKQKLNKHTGYLMIGLNSKGKATNYTIHSMVARAFIENYKPEGTGKGRCTNHKDGNKLNNHVENLEVITISENVRHMFKNGLTTNSHKVKYNGIEYYSKSEMRRVLKMPEKIQNKMIKEGSVEVL